MIVWVYIPYIDTRLYMEITNKHWLYAVYIVAETCDTHVTREAVGVSIRTHGHKIKGLYVILSKHNDGVPATYSPTDTAGTSSRGRTSTHSALKKESAPTSSRVYLFMKRSFMVPVLIVCSHPVCTYDCWATDSVKLTIHNPFFCPICIFCCR